jgi:methionyl-tRNA formyltransferase
MRIVLIGAVESTAVTLDCMIESGYPPISVVGLDKTLAARHSDFVDMETRAREAGITFIPVRSVNAPEVVERITSLEPDWLVVVGWSQICHAALLAIPRLGAIGYHPSPLPELRGRAVLAWTLLLGRETTGGSLFALEPTVDSGDILAQRLFPVVPRETLSSLICKHLSALSDMWRELLPKMVLGPLVGRPQDPALASHCAKRTAEDGRVDWTGSVYDIDRLVRAVTAPYPGAFSDRGDDRLQIWEAEPFVGPTHYGLPGQVLAVGEKEILIACRLGEALAVRRWSWPDEKGASPLRVGDRLS